MEGDPIVKREKTQGPSLMKLKNIGPEWSVKNKSFSFPEDTRKIIVKIIFRVSERACIEFRDLNSNS
jgi:hypothetical protein